MNIVLTALFLVVPRVFAYLSPESDGHLDIYARDAFMDVDNSYFFDTRDAEADDDFDLLDALYARYAEAEAYVEAGPPARGPLAALAAMKQRNKKSSEKFRKQEKKTEAYNDAVGMFHS